MNRAVQAWLALALVVVVGAVALWVALGHPRTVGVRDGLAAAGAFAGGDPEEAAGDSTASIGSGFVEADVLPVSAEVGGQVIDVLAGEGDQVAEGQVLAQLDDSVLQARIAVAEADLATARATLELLKAGSTPAELRRAEAEADQARSARNAAQRAWQDALAMLENPQELDLALAAARGDLAVLRYQEKQAGALANAEQVGRDFADEALRTLQSIEPRDEPVLVGEYDLDELPPWIPLPADPLDGEYSLDQYKIVVHDGVATIYGLVTVRASADMLQEARDGQAAATYSSWAAWAGLDQAKAARQGVEPMLAEMVRQRQDPRALQVRVLTAEAQHGVAAAAVHVAESQVEGIKIGATTEQISVAQAQVDAAQAALGALWLEKEQHTVKAPVQGIVVERTARRGDVAAAGMPLLALADLAHLSMRAYVAEARLDELWVGQGVVVTVDAFPGRAFPAAVRSIASEAEFSPRGVQTREERANVALLSRCRSITRACV